MTDVSPEIESLVELDRENLAQQLREHLGETVNNIEILKVQRRPYSTTTILAAITGSGPHRFVLKQIVKNPLNASVFEGSERSAVEYDILSQLSPKFAGIERCSVPLPIIVLPEIDAFLMEYVEGYDLVNDLRFIHYLSSRSLFRKLQDNMHDCGRWLRHFQKFTGTRFAGKSALDTILVRCNDRLSMIEESRDQRCPRDFRKIATGYIEKQLSQLDNTEILVTGRHGDFGPWNTMATPNGVTVIDFFNYREDAFPVDILGMLVYLESISHGIANSSHRIQILQNCFLAGLGSLPEVPQPLALLCEAQQRIIKIDGAVLATSGVGLIRTIRWTESWENSRSLSANVKWFQSHPQQSSIWPR
jgi:hypothetical protein